MEEIVYSTGDRPSPEEYVGFLRRSELGRMYPEKDFEPRIARLSQHAGVVVTARDHAELVGVCLGVTDYAYFLFITDIGVVRGFDRQGIGRELLRHAHEAAGGAHDITVVAWSNAPAMPFYAACGLLPREGLVGREAPGWL